MVLDTALEFAYKLIGSENLKSTILGIFVFYLLLNVRDTLTRHDMEIKYMKEKVDEMKTQLNRVQDEQRNRPNRGGRN